MKMEILLIRHGKTKANLRREYTGRIDYPLCDEGVNELKVLSNMINSILKIEMLFSSPMIRCIETSKIYYPNYKPIIIENLKEIDFGIFEGKTFEELSHIEEFQKFVEHSWQSNIPDGENPKDFSKRCLEGFNEVINILQDNNKKYGVIVCHGGVIMSLLHQLIIDDTMDFYDYYSENGKGYHLSYDTLLKKTEIIRKI